MTTSDRQRPARILIAEATSMGRAFVRAELESVLKQEHCPEAEFIEVGSGLNAIARLEAGNFDLAIIDFSLPNAGGEETVRQIRSNQKHADLPIAVLGSDDGAAQIRALTSGANYYLSKPVAPSALSKLVRILLRP